MMTPRRVSPLHDSLQALAGSWCEINGMPTLAAIAHQPPATFLAMVDLSFLTCFGVKGAQAADWLMAAGIAVPDRPNTWHFLADQALIARLGSTEFLIQDSRHSLIAPRLTQAAQSLPAQVYPVLHQDAAIGLWGLATPELFRQTCSVNFSAYSLVEQPVILTSMIGVAVIVIPGAHAGQPFYRVWCDGTYGAYLWRTLLEIVTAFGGGAIGADQVPIN